MKVWLCLWLAFAAPVAAQDAVAAAEAAAARLAQARVLLDEAQTKANRVAALTETVRAYEDGLVAMREGLRRAAIREGVLEAQLNGKREEIGQLLAVLQRMGRAPAPVLMLHPNGPVGTARGGMIAADVAPAIQTEVEALRAQLAEVAALRALQETAADTLTEGLRGAQDARAALSAAVAARTDLPRRFSDDPVQTALLMASTDTLEGFAGGLAGALDEVLSDTPANEELKGSLPLPVSGTVLRGFNAPDAAGITRPGIIIAARPGALVTVPVPMTLLFRGELLDYGNVVIVEPAADVMIVLAGLGDAFGEPGQVLPAGTPVGLMGGEPLPADAILNESAGGTPPAANQTLYLEVRDGQSPVNPADWFVLE